jgi:hypothetical protein
VVGLAAFAGSFGALAVFAPAWAGRVVAGLSATVLTGVAADGHRAVRDEPDTGPMLTRLHFVQGVRQYVATRRKRGADFERSLDQRQVAAVAADELSMSIAEIGHRLDQTAEVVRVAVGEAQVTNQDIGALAIGAQKIGDVTKLISNIVAQTNLLALKRCPCPNALVHVGVAIIGARDNAMIPIGFPDHRHRWP